MALNLLHSPGFGPHPSANPLYMVFKREDVQVYSIQYTGPDHALLKCRDIPGPILAALRNGQPRKLQLPDGRSAEFVVLSATPVSISISSTNIRRFSSTLGLSGHINIFERVYIEYFYLRRLSGGAYDKNERLFDDASRLYTRPDGVITCDISRPSSLVVPSVSPGAILGGYGSEMDVVFGVRIEVWTDNSRTTLLDAHNYENFCIAHGADRVMTGIPDRASVIKPYVRGYPMLLSYILPDLRRVIYLKHRFFDSGGTLIRRYGADPVGGWWTFKKITPLNPDPIVSMISLDTSLFPDKVSYVEFTWGSYTHNPIS